MHDHVADRKRGRQAVTSRKHVNNVSVAAGMCEHHACKINALACLTTVAQAVTTHRSPTTAGPSLVLTPQQVATIPTETRYSVRR